jgi:hypothetical protein
MPKKIRDPVAHEFGRRLVRLMADAGHPRRGAGAYLAKRYGFATVTANAWLNGEHRASTDMARRIAEDHGSTFDALYFGLPQVDPVSVSGNDRAQDSAIRIRRVAIRGVVMVGMDGFWRDVEQSALDEGYGVATNDPDAYAIRIVGRRYHPAIESGQCVLVEPNSPLKVARKALIVLTDGRHAVRSFLSHQDGVWLFMSLLDANDILELPDDQVVAAYRISTTFDAD